MKSLLYGLLCYLVKTTEKKGKKKKKNVEIYSVESNYKDERERIKIKSKVYRGISISIDIFVLKSISFFFYK
jgi:hypothetical protein